MRALSGLTSTKMTQVVVHRGFTAYTATGLVTGIAVAIVGGLFLAEGLLGYFYSYSMFLEGTDHIWEMSGGLLAAAAGAILAVYAALRR